MIRNPVARSVEDEFCPFLTKMRIMGESDREVRSLPQGSDKCSRKFWTMVRPAMQGTHRRIVRHMDDVRVLVCTAAPMEA